MERKKRKKRDSVGGDSGGEAKVFVSGELWRSMQHAQSEPDFPTRDSRLRSLFQSTDANKQTSFIRVKQQKPVGFRDFAEKETGQDVNTMQHETSSQLPAGSMLYAEKELAMSRKRPRNQTRRQQRYPERDKRTIFVGNLPLAVTQQALKRLFREYGCIETVRLRGAIARNPKIPKKASVIKKQFHPDQDSISGYVVFKEESAAQDALSRNGDTVDGRHIRVDHADREKDDYKKSVFVGNLPYVVDEEALRELFSQCGDVCAVRIVRDRKSGVGKGFGYVHFKAFRGLNSKKLSRLKDRKIKPRLKFGSSVRSRSGDKMSTSNRKGKARRSYNVTKSRRGRPYKSAVKT